MRAFVGWLCLGASTLFPASVLCQSSCPASTMTCDFQESSSTEPSGQISCPEGSSNATYDLTRGIVRASAQHYCCLSASTGARVLAQDDFTIVGVPPGETVTFQARLSVFARGCSSSQGSGSGDAGLWENASRNAEGNYTNFARVSADPYPGQPGCLSVDGTAQITLKGITGDSITLTYDASASGVEGGGGEAYGRLSFAGLPPGAIIRSCQGFVQEFPVPTIPLSWGSLKQRYH